MRNRFGFFKNQYNLNAAGSQPVAPTYNITANLVDPAIPKSVNFGIDTTLPANITLYWTITGNVTSGDFTDLSGLSGTVTTDVNGNALVTKDLNVIGFSNVDFALNVKEYPVTSIKATSPTVSTANANVMSATGGTTSYVTDNYFTVHLFNTSANLNVVSTGDANLLSNINTLDYLLVGGGGKGGSHNNYTPALAGGGGGGEVYESSANVTGLGNIVVGVGLGSGYAGTPATRGANSNISLGNIEVYGGGNGGEDGYTGQDGGAGGGGSIQGLTTTTARIGNYGNAVTNYGTASRGGPGGILTTTNLLDARSMGAGGGGGAGGTGNGAADTGIGSNGGGGIFSSITGTSIAYGSGGGGVPGKTSGGSLIVGGFGGGPGAGDGASSLFGASGTNGSGNYGAGGGGLTGGGSPRPAYGGNGTVIFKYVSSVRKLVV